MAILLTSLSVMQNYGLSMDFEMFPNLQDIAMKKMVEMRIIIHKTVSRPEEKIYFLILLN